MVVKVGLLLAALLVLLGVVFSPRSAVQAWPPEPLKKQGAVVPTGSGVQAAFQPPDPCLDFFARICHRGVPLIENTQALEG
jgi:hypothetical protein